MNDLAIKRKSNAELVMNRISILFGHPAFKRSTINAALREAVEDLQGITFHDLYASYPDFLIDVHHEQHLCKSHDVTGEIQCRMFSSSTPTTPGRFLKVS